MSVFGIVLFLIFGGMAFWLLLFTLGFIVPLWITLGIREKLRPKRIFEDNDEDEEECGHRKHDHHEVHDKGV